MILYCLLNPKWNIPDAIIIIKIRSNCIKTIVHAAKSVTKYQDQRFKNSFYFCKIIFAVNQRVKVPSHYNEIPLGNFASSKCCHIETLTIYESLALISRPQKEQLSIPKKQRCRQEGKKSKKIQKTIAFNRLKERKAWSIDLAESPLVSTP